MSSGHKTIQYQLRMTEEMREKIKQSAEKNNRSMNADIILRLEQSLAQDDGNEVIGVSFDTKWLGDNIDQAKFSKAIDYLFNKALEEDIKKENK